MEAFKIILTVIFILICIALTVIVLLQEGKQAGLGAISGAAETYWGKNKGRSIEGKLEKSTKMLVIAFLVVAAILNTSVFNSSSTSNSNVVTETSEMDNTLTTTGESTTTQSDTTSGTSAE